MLLRRSKKESQIFTWSCTIVQRGQWWPAIKLLLRLSILICRGPMVRSERFRRRSVRKWTVKGARRDSEGTCFGGSTHGGRLEQPWISLSRRSSWGTRCLSRGHMACAWSGICKSSRPHLQPPRAALVPRMLQGAELHCHPLRKCALGRYVHCRSRIAVKRRSNNAPVCIQ